MANYVLIHGASDSGSHWDLVANNLRKRGHHVVAPDMPFEDESATLSDCADAVIRASGDREDLIVVGHSFGGYVAPIVASRAVTRLLILVAAMIPKPGESALAMYENTGYQQEPQEDPSLQAVFYHDIPEDVALAALANARNHPETGFADPWPLASWPDVPTRSIVGRNDRLFPVAWMRKVNQDRLGITPDEINTGHCVALAKPLELTSRLEAYRLNN